MRTPDTHLAELAERQHGIFTRRQALEAGLSRDQLKRRRAKGLIVAVDFGVYRFSATPMTWHQRLIAPCLAGPAVASHRSAGLLWRFPSMPEGIVEVTALRHRRRHASDVVWHESYHLSERDITVVEGIQVTRPVRTFVDLGVVLDLAALEEVLDNGLHRGLLSYPAIWRCLERFRSVRPGWRRVQGLLETRQAERPSTTVLETRFRQLLRDAGLPPAVPQYEVRAGDIHAYIDFAYPDRRIAIELDGSDHFGERAQRYDRTRENAVAALGWRFLRFTWADVHDRPGWVVGTLRLAIATPA